MKPFERLEFSGFARVNKNGHRSVGNNLGALAGVSDVSVHPGTVRVCGVRRISSPFTWCETAHVGLAGRRCWHLARAVGIRPVLGRI